MFAASTVNGVASSLKNQLIGSPGVGPLWLRIGRVGDVWKGSYSFDGVSFTQYVSFTRALEVTAAGPFAGNSGSSPAHTAVVDYFFDTSSPVVPEDGGAVEFGSVSTAVVGSGVVELSPGVGSYPVGTEVTATAAVLEICFELAVCIDRRELA